MSDPDSVDFALSGINARQLFNTARNRRAGLSRYHLFATIDVVTVFRGQL